MQEVKLFLDRFDAASLALQENVKSFSLTELPSKSDQLKTIEVGKAYEDLKLEGQQLLMRLLTRTVKAYAKELGVTDSFLRSVRAGDKKISRDLMRKIEDDNISIGELIGRIK